MNDFNIETTIGLDLGTSNSCCFCYYGGRLEVVKDNGKTIIPSAVNYRNDKIVVGCSAVASQSGKNKLIREVKRIIGQNYSSTVVQEFINHVNYDVVKTDGDGVGIKIEYGGSERVLSAMEIYVQIIKHFKKLAEKLIGQIVTDIILTVPAYFGEYQRNETKQAAQIANLNVVRIINEPTAAALAYGCEHIDENKTILIYDLGGGTFDVCIMSIVDYMYEVIASMGDAHLGGIDFSLILEGMIRKYLKELTHENEIVSANFDEKIRKCAEETKMALSSTTEYIIDVSELIDDSTDSITITRDAFINQSQDLINRTVSIVKKCILDANMTEADFDDIIMIGGSSKIPSIVESLKEEFPDHEIKKTINPDEAVAMGAMYFAVLTSGRQARGSRPIQLEEAIAPNIFPTQIRMTVVEQDDDDDDDIIIKGDDVNTTDISILSPPYMPYTYTIDVYNPELDSISDINMIKPRVIIQEKTLFNYAVKDGYDGVYVVVPANSKLPVVGISHRARTTTDYQSNATFQFCQGNSMSFRENTFLGTIVVSNIPRKLKEMVIFSVNYSVDVNSTVKVSVVVNETGESTTVSLESKQNRSEQEIERMIEREREMEEVARQTEMKRARDKLLEQLHRCYNIMNSSGVLNNDRMITTYKQCYDFMNNSNDASEVEYDIWKETLITVFVESGFNRYEIDV